MLPLELLQLLACPDCKGELIPSADGSSLYCNPCSRVYPIFDGIPMLLPEQKDAVLQKKCEAS